MKRIPRSLALAALALAVTGVTAGCSEFSEQTTTLQYTPSDGVQADLDGGVQVRNAFFVAEDAESPGTLVTTVVNNGDEDVTVMVTGDGINAEIDVPAREAVQVGPEGDEQIEVSSINAVPGELVPLNVSTGTAAAELEVPVVSGDLPEYAELVPTSS